MDKAENLETISIFKQSEDNFSNKNIKDTAQNYKKMLDAKSVIRQMSEWATGRAKEIGNENVFDFSLGNPNLAAPDGIKNAIKSVIEEEDAVLVCNLFLF